MGKRIPLPKAVAKIYEAVSELQSAYPNRKFTPDGHLIGSIGEVIAAEALALTLHPASYPGHDAFDNTGNVQIKMVGPTARRVSFYSECERLVVLQIISTTEAEIVYDGPGEPVWKIAGKEPSKNGQRTVSIKAIKAIHDLQNTH